MDGVRGPSHHISKCRQTGKTNTDYPTEMFEFNSQTHADTEYRYRNPQASLIPLSFNRKRWLAGYDFDVREHVVLDVVNIITLLSTCF